MDHTRAPSRSPLDEDAAIEDRPERRRRIKQLEVMVADVIEETHDTSTLVLFTGNDRLDYEPGHFLTIDPHQFEALDRFIAFLEDMKGAREPPRAYSLSSAPHDKHLAFTVKEERYVPGVTRYPPLLSPLLVKRTPRGTRMVVTGFTGPYTLPPDVETRAEHLVHVCAGSGIVPNFSILQHSLLVHPRLRHTVVCSNRTWRDVIFLRQLDRMALDHPGRIRVVHALTREPGAEHLGTDIHSGRVSTKLLRGLIRDPAACLVFACGPAISGHDRELARENGSVPAARFMETVLQALDEIGVPKDRMLCESYG